MPSQSVRTQLERLMSVVAALPQRRQAVTPRQLFEARDWGVDIRTLQRDLKSLEKLGLAERRPRLRDDLEDSRSDRWCATARNPLQSRRLTTEQAIALGHIERLSGSLLPEQVLVALRQDFEEARTLLIAQRNVDPRTRWADKVEVIPDTLTGKAVTVKPKILRNLQTALLTNSQVQARYSSRARGRGKSRVIEPRALVQVGPTLFVIATQPARPNYEPAWHAVHRFVSARVLPTLCSRTAFNLKEHLDRGGAQFGASGPPIVFKAWVSRDLKRTLREAPISEDMKVLGDKRGGAIVTATVRRSWPFQRWLLSRGPELRVIDPPELREYMVSKLRTALKGYRGSRIP
jgi:predicted DNA-binding transcriptional regulator YafY